MKFDSTAALFERRHILSPEDCAAQNMEEYPSCLCDTPLGPVRIIEDPQGIRSLKFTGSRDAPIPSGPAGIYLEDTRKQLLEYFAGKRKMFDIPLSTHGSAFQEKVWDALRSIPYGETRSYQQIAQSLGNDKATRAVGMANNRNPILILIPCHRVIGKSGRLVGYAGGIERKKRLLELETAK